MIEYHLLRLYELEEPYSDDQATFASVRTMQLEHAKKGVRTTAAALAPPWFGHRWFEQTAPRAHAAKQEALLKKIEQIPWGKPPKRTTEKE